MLRNESRVLVPQRTALVPAAMVLETIALVFKTRPTVLKPAIGEQLALPHGHTVLRPA